MITVAFTLPDSVLRRIGDRSTAYYDIQWDFAHEFLDIMCGTDRSMQRGSGGIEVTAVVDSTQAQKIADFLQHFGIVCRLSADRTVASEVE